MICCCLKSNFTEMSQFQRLWIKKTTFEPAEMADAEVCTMFQIQNWRAGSPTPAMGTAWIL